MSELQEILRRYREARARLNAGPPPPPPVLPPVEGESRPSWMRFDVEVVTRSTVPPPRILVEDIIRVVAHAYGLSRIDLVAHRRTRTIVLPRQIAMYLARTMTTRSLPEIGRRFSNRDHTTVLHAVKKIEALEKKDENIASILKTLKAAVIRDANQLVKWSM